MGPSFEEAGDLHAQGRAARDDTPGAQRLAGGAKQGDGIDARMASETLVLEGCQLGDEAGVHVGDSDGQAPSAIGDGVGRQQGARAVDDEGRCRGRQRRQDGRRHPCVEPRGEARRQGQRGKGEPQRFHDAVFMMRTYRPVRTLTVPAAVRAR